MLAKLASDSGKYLISKIAVSLAWVIALKLYTQYLSPELFGHYSLLIAFQAYTLVFSSAWISGAIIRYEALHRDLNRVQFERFSSELTLASISVTLIPVLIALLSFRVFFQVELTATLVSLIIAHFAVNTWLQSQYALLRARRQLRRYVFLYGAQTFGALVFALIFFKLKPSALVPIFLGQLVAAVLTTLYFARAKFTRIYLSFRFMLSPVQKEMLRYGLPILWINLFTQLLSNGDQFLLKRMGFGVELGQYSAQYQLAQNSLFAFTSLMSSALSPLLFEGWEKGERKETLRSLQRLARLFALITAPAALAMVLFEKPILTLFFRAEYLSGPTIVPWVAFGAFFVGVANVYSEAFTLSKRTWLLGLCYGVAAALNLGLNLVLIPRKGVEGAAIASFVAYFGLWLLIWIVYRALLPRLTKEIRA